MRSVSIRAVPKISLMCQENPDNDFGRAEEIRSKQAQYCGELWAMRIVSSTGLSRHNGTPTLPVDSVSGRERPENPRVFVRHRHAGDEGAIPALDGLHPPTARILFISRAAYHRSRHVQQESPQVAVTPLADAEQPRASALDLVLQSRNPGVAVLELHGFHPVSTKLQWIAVLAREAP